MARREDEERPICESDQCPQCGADIGRVSAEYVGIVDAISALGCPDDIATVEWVESLVRERDAALAEVASLRQELWRERTIAANQKLDRDIMAQAIVAGSCNRDRRR